MKCNYASAYSNLFFNYIYNYIQHIMSYFTILNIYYEPRFKCFKIYIILELH